MPEKDGADDKKTTKSVVNKKQKQMMGEEGYDIARDMGRVKPSKDKKDGTSYPPSPEMKKTQKVNKGPSAYERVKKKYGKSVMNVKKEELDLTPVAESFGGHIVEFVNDGIRKALEKTLQKTTEKVGQKTVQTVGKKAAEKAGQKAVQKVGQKVGQSAIVATGRNLPANKIVSTGRTFKGFQDKVKTVTPQVVQSTPFDKKTSAITKVAPKEIAKVKPKTSTLVRGGVKQDAITTATDTAIDKISNRRPPTTGEKQPPTKTKSEKDKPSDGVQLHLGKGGRSSFVMAG